MRRGLMPLSTLANEMNAQPNELVNAPKAEWHHDLNTGRKIWFYDRRVVWEWLTKRRKYLRQRPSLQNTEAR